MVVERLDIEDVMDLSVHILHHSLQNILRQTEPPHGFVKRWLVPTL